MAEREEMLKTKRDGVVLEDDTLEYCKKIYAESSDRIDQLRDINVENIEFYEGIDQKLVSRAADPNVKRSALFVHQLTPAIDTRIGEIVSKLEEREFPVMLTPKNKMAEAGELDNIAFVEAELNRQLRESGYLSDVFIEQAKAAEINETPAAVILGWRRDMVSRAVVDQPTDSDMEDAVVAGEIPKPRVRFVDEEIGMPYVEFIPPDEFMYEPGVSLFEKDSTYVGRRQYKYRQEVMSLAKQYGWDVKKVTQFFEEQDANQSSENTTQATVGEQVEADRGTAIDADAKKEKALLVYWWIVRYNDAGRKETQYVVVLGNQYIIYKKIDQFKGFDFPFVILVPNRKVGSFENISSVSRGKPMQKVYNEVFNSFIDGISYRIFPPFKKRNGNNFANPPIYGPGQMWSLDDPEDLKPVIENPGMMPDLPSLMSAVGSQIRDLLSAQDFQQGYNAQPYEKATSAKLRALGAARRSTPSHKAFGLAIVDIARKFIMLNQQFDKENGHMWVVDVDIDVPSLTNISDPEQEKQDALLMYTQMVQDPMFATPAGKRLRRNAWERVARTFNKTNAELYIMKKEDLENDIEVETEMQKTIIDKQSIADTAAVVGSAGVSNAT